VGAYLQPRKHCLAYGLVFGRIGQDGLTYSGCPGAVAEKGGTDKRKTTWYTLRGRISCYAIGGKQKRVAMTSRKIKEDDTLSSESRTLRKPSEFGGREFGSLSAAWEGKKNLCSPNIKEKCGKRFNCLGPFDWVGELNGLLTPCGRNPGSPHHCASENQEDTKLNSKRDNRGKSSPQIQEKNSLFKTNLWLGEMCRALSAGKKGLLARAVPDCVSRGDNRGVSCEGGVVTPSICKNGGERAVSGINKSTPNRSSDEVKKTQRTRDGRKHRGKEGKDEVLLTTTEEQY